MAGNPIADWFMIAGLGLLALMVIGGLVGLLWRSGHRAALDHEGGSPLPMIRKPRR